MVHVEAGVHTRLAERSSAWFSLPRLKVIPQEARPSCARLGRWDTCSYVDSAVATWL